MWNGDNPDPRASQLFEEALAARSESLEKVIQLLDGAVQVDPRMLGICEGVKGCTIWEQTKQPELAFPHLQRATELRPLACAPSLTLFHVLLNLCRVGDAIAEGERFLTAFDSSNAPETERVKDYREIHSYVKNLTDREIDELHFDLAERMVKREAEIGPAD